jgi:hypothetical protein
MPETIKRSVLVTFVSYNKVTEINNLKRKDLFWSWFQRVENMVVGPM